MPVNKTTTTVTQSDSLRKQIELLTNALIETERAEEASTDLKERLSGMEDGAIVVVYLRFRSSLKAEWGPTQFAYPFLYAKGYFYGRFTANNTHHADTNANKYTVDQLMGWLTVGNRMIEGMYVVTQMEEI